jgi:hypothetical protein
MQLFLGSLLILLFFAASGSLVVVRAQSASMSERRDMGIIKDAQGPVCLIRGGRGECKPTKRGATLRKGDVLRVEESGVATVRCYCPPPTAEPNTSPRYEAVPCPNTCPRRLGTGIHATVASILPDTLALRIPPLAGTSTYSLTISGPNLKWSTDIGSEKFTLPADAPKLAPDVTYAVFVADKRSPEKSFPALNISLLNEEDANTVRAIVKEIRGLDLTESEKQIRVAELYVTWGLNIEALNILETVQGDLGKQEWDKSPVDLLLTVGDLYLSVGLVAPAGEYYSKAYDLAKKTNDLTHQAYALEGLGVTFAMDGEFKDANSKFMKASTTFEKAGDIENAARLNQFLQIGSP